MAWFLNILDAICILLCFTPNRYPFTEFGKNSTKVSKWVKNNAWFLAWFLTILDAICILIYFTPNIYPFTEFGKNSTKVSKWVKTALRSKFEFQIIIKSPVRIPTQWILQNPVRLLHCYSKRQYVKFLWISNFPMTNFLPIVVRFLYFRT
jgi:hypothetical protein